MTSDLIERRRSRYRITTSYAPSVSSKRRSLVSILALCDRTDCEMMARTNFVEGFRKKQSFWVIGQDR